MRFFRFFPTFLSNPPHPSKLSNGVAITLSIFILVTILLTVLWSVALHRLTTEGALIRENAARQQENIATIVAGSLSQVLDRGRLLAVSASQSQDKSPTRLTQTINALRGIDGAILRIALYKPDGTPLLPAPPNNPHAAKGQKIVDELLQREGVLPDDVRVAFFDDVYGNAWEIPLLYPVVDDEGNQQGALLAVVDIGFFLGLFQNIQIGQSGLIQIFSESGHLLAEADRVGMTLIVNRHPLDPIPPRSEQALSKIEPVTDPRTARLSSHHYLKHFPLFVTVSSRLDDIDHEQNQRRQRLISLLAVTSLVLILAALWIIRNIQRNGELLHSLTAVNQNNARLIEQLEEERNRAFHLAALDHLTGLHNRRMFHELVTSHLHGAKRSQRQSALMYLDLDRFKQINDTLGHHVGDLLLQTVATRLKNALRESDVIARLGGDEFAVLLTGIDSPLDVQAIADKVIQHIGLPCSNLDGNTLQITPSVGIALFPRDGHDFETLCRHADTAMYHAKKNGRGRHCFYEPALGKDNHRQQLLEQQLPSAIAHDQLRVYWQPQIDARDNRLLGFEALLRWQHPEHGLLAPDDFIGLAENSTTLQALGTWVVETSCAQLATWRQAGLPCVPIAMNFTVNQLLDRKLPQRIADIARQHGVDRQLLKVDIPERALTESFEQTANALYALHKIGISIALDHFACGFANLAHIRALPIDTLKIGQPFIQAFHNDDEHVTIIEAIITLAHKLQKRVIAVGVESNAQHMRFKLAGCDILQGMLFSPPLPTEAATEYLAQATPSTSEPPQS